MISNSPINVLPLGGLPEESGGGGNQYQVQMSTSLTTIGQYLSAALRGIQLSTNTQLNAYRNSSIVKELFVIQSSLAASVKLLNVNITSHLNLQPSKSVGMFKELVANLNGIAEVIKNYSLTIPLTLQTSLVISPTISLNVFRFYMQELVANVQLPASLAKVVGKVLESIEQLNASVKKFLTKSLTTVTTLPSYIGKGRSKMLSTTLNISPLLYAVKGAITLLTNIISANVGFAKNRLATLDFAKFGNLKSSVFRKIFSKTIDY